MDFHQLERWFAVIVFIVVPLLRKLSQRKKEATIQRQWENEETQQADAIDAPIEESPPLLASHPGRHAYQAAQIDPTQAIIQRAVTLREQIDHEHSCIRLRTPYALDVTKELDGGFDFSTNASPRELLVRIENYEILATQRLAHPNADVLGDLDAIGDACLSPILSFAEVYSLPIPQTPPISYFANLQHLQKASTHLSPLPLSSTIARDLWQWPQAVRALADWLWDNWKGLEPSLRKRFNISSTDLSFYTYEGNVSDFFIAIWLRTIFVDVLCTLWLGPAYAEVLLYEAANNSEKKAVQSRPPHALRLWIVASTLDAEGQYDSARSLQNRTKTTRMHEQVLVIQGAEVPVTALKDPFEKFLKNFLRGQWPELAEHQWLSVHGMPYLHSEHRLTMDAATLFLKGQRVTSLSPRLALAAAIMAATSTSPDQTDKIRVALSNSIRGIGNEHHSESSVRRHSPTPKNLLAHLKRDIKTPAMWSQAIIWGSALGKK